MVATPSSKAIYLRLYAAYPLTLMCFLMDSYAIAAPAVVHKVTLTQIVDQQWIMGTLSELAASLLLRHTGNSTQATDCRGIVWTTATYLECAISGI